MQERPDWEILEEISERLRQVHGEIAGLGIVLILMAGAALWHFW